ncbi:MAG: helix-turn-helix domain-containing protein [Myxococcales bacterium]|nr:MAG: helix-turn-helix domain-containing protein [Myxococcales bacterium]
MKDLEKQIDSKQNLVVSSRKNYRAGRIIIDEHAHKKHQIIIPRSGSIQVIASDHGTYMATSGQGFFIKAHQNHHAIYSGVISVDNLYLSPQVCDLLPDTFVFEITSLLSALAERLCKKLHWDKLTKELSSLCYLLCEEIKNHHQPASFLPRPNNTQLLAITTSIENNVQYMSSIKDIAKKLNMSERHFRRFFQAECKMSFSAWLTRLKIMLAKEMLAGTLPISEIALELGFEEFGSFSRFFKKNIGVTPAQWRNNYLREV